MGNLVESFCGEKGPFGQDHTARKKIVPSAIVMTERFTTGKNGM